MREEQVELLMRMKPLIESICHKDPLLNDVASLLKEIGLNVNSNDYTAMRLHNLYETRLKWMNCHCQQHTKRLTREQVLFKY